MKIKSQRIEGLVTAICDNVNKTSISVATTATYIAVA